MPAKCRSDLFPVPLLVGYLIVSGHCTAALLIKNFSPEVDMKDGVDIILYLELQLIFLSLINALLSSPQLTHRARIDTN